MLKSMTFLLVASLLVLVPQNVLGHGVSNWEQQITYVKFENEVFSTNTVQVGQPIEIAGQIVAISDIKLTSQISIFAESNNLCNQWVISGSDIGMLLSQGEKRSYSMTITPSLPGVYHVHSMVSVEGYGQALGPGQTILVTNGDLQSIPFYCQAVNLPIIIGGTVSGLGAIVVAIFVIRKKKGRKPKTEESEKQTTQNTEELKKPKMQPDHDDNEPDYSLDDSKLK